MRRTGTSVAGLLAPATLRRLHGLAHGLDDVAHHLVHQALVVALGHDADHGLGAGRANDEPAAGCRARSRPASMAFLTASCSSGEPLA